MVHIKSFTLILIGILYLMKPYIFAKRFVQTLYKTYQNGEYLNPMLFPPVMCRKKTGKLNFLVSSINKNKYFGALHLCSLSIIRFL
jgi:hypothetical protein